MPVRVRHQRRAKYYSIRKGPPQFVNLSRNENYENLYRPARAPSARILAPEGVRAVRRGHTHLVTTFFAASGTRARRRCGKSTLTMVRILIILIFTKNENLVRIW